MLFLSVHHLYHVYFTLVYTRMHHSSSPQFFACLVFTSKRTFWQFEMTQTGCVSSCIVPAYNDVYIVKISHSNLMLYIIYFSMSISYDYYMYVWSKIILCIAVLYSIYDYANQMGVKLGCLVCIKNAINTKSKRYI